MLRAYSVAFVFVAFVSVALVSVALVSVAFVSVSLAIRAAQDQKVRSLQKLHYLKQ